MDPWLRTLTALAYDLGLVSSTQPTWLTAAYNFIYTLFSDLCGHCTHEVCIYTCRKNSHLHKIKIKITYIFHVQHGFDTYVLING